MGKRGSPVLWKLATYTPPIHPVPKTLQTGLISESPTRVFRKNINKQIPGPCSSFVELEHFFQFSQPCLYSWGFSKCADDGIPPQTEGDSWVWDWTMTSFKVPLIQLASGCTKRGALGCAVRVWLGHPPRLASVHLLSTCCTSPSLV